MSHSTAMSCRTEFHWKRLTSGGDYIVIDGVKAGERLIAEGIHNARPGSMMHAQAQPVSLGADTRKQGV